MNVKTLTMTVAIALLATTALPVAAAHWRTTAAPLAWDSPHEHEFVLHSSTAPSIYSGKFQRMCLTGTALTWGTQDGCPPPGAVTPPVRGVTSGGINCFDLDSIGHPNYVKNLPRQNGLSSVVLDWGATAQGPGLDGKYNFADHFAWPILGSATPGKGNTANPTGASVAHYPVLVQAVPGVVQLDITVTGTGPTGSGGAGGASLPGVDTGDNDFEFCRGGASFPYAIDSGTAKNVKVNGVVTPLEGAGVGLNDIRGIGGDCVYDVVACSPVVGKGGTFPATSATPVGVLLDFPAIRDPAALIPYSVCSDVAGAGCTNIPTTGTVARLGNGVEGNAVYSSSQNCVWSASYGFRDHAVSGRDYRGVKALWATTTPAGDGTQTCWPERLVRSSALPTSIYLPSSQSLQTATGLADGAWNPDKLPATPTTTQTIAVFVDVAEMRNFHNFHSGCPTGQSVLDRSGCGTPTTSTPDQWFAAPNSISGLAAVFHPL